VWRIQFSAGCHGQQASSEGKGRQGRRASKREAGRGGGEREWWRRAAAMESKGEGAVQGRSRKMPEKEDGASRFT
jgi:hypothetical protein